MICGHVKCDFPHPHILPPPSILLMGNTIIFFDHKINVMLANKRFLGKYMYHGMINQSPLNDDALCMLDTSLYPKHMLRLKQNIHNLI